MNSAQHVGNEARQASRSPLMRGLARTGLAARGVIYLIIGVLALLIAFGNTSRKAESGGALQAIAEKPGGTLALWLMAAGFVGLALWRFAEAAFGQAGPDGDKPGKRLLSLGRGVFYSSLLVTTVTYALGVKNQQSSDSQSKDLTGRAMKEVTGGQWIVAIAGLVLIGIAIGMAYRAAVKRKFMEKLNTAQMSPETRKGVEMLGRIGRSARAFGLAVGGAFLAYAGFTFDPGKARGVDGTLRELRDSPAGVWLLVVVALGLVAFGVYSFCEAKWRRVTPG
jgi:hypothetical protein